MLFVKRIRVNEKPKTLRKITEYHKQNQQQQPRSADTPYTQIDGIMFEWIIQPIMCTHS